MNLNDGYRTLFTDDGEAAFAAVIAAGQLNLVTPQNTTPSFQADRHSGFTSDNNEIEMAVFELPPGQDLKVASAG